MSIELATVSKSKTTDTSTTSSSTSSSSKEGSTSFKEQLDSIKAQEAKTAETEEAKAAETTDAKKAETAQQSKAEETAKTKAATENEAATTDKEALDPLNALSAKISTINELKEKNNFNSKIQNAEVKTEDLKSNKNAYCQVINFDSNDAAFFIGLVGSQEMSAQNAQALGMGQTVNNNFTQIKSEATQQTVQISQTLMDALNDSSKTGKSVRIDFDSNIAVIMKLDKNGTISANFIPGDSAVENYLRNNIAGLKQSFDNQNLAYNELTYSKQQHQEKQEKQKQNKENQDE